MMEKVTKLALTSRLIVLLLQLLANAALPDHQPDVFRAPSSSDLNTANTLLDKTVHFCLGGLRHWDGEYFLHIAEHSYSYENTLAFYPLYPLLVRSGALILHYCIGGDVLLSLHSCALLVAVLLNVLCFCQAANTLYALTQRIFGDAHKSWNVALLFCFNPASIFFTAAYSETLFTLLSLQLMLECVCQLRVTRCIGTLALGIVTRSNGLINTGFPVYFVLRRLLLQTPAPNVRRCLSTALKLVLSFFCALLPLAYFCYYSWQKFCLPIRTEQHTQAVVDYADSRDYILAGQRQSQQSPWCDFALPTPYGYIQSHYWHVGLLRYYKLKQLPNFMLAMPVLSFLFYHCCRYLWRFRADAHRLYQHQQVEGLKLLLRAEPSLPFVLHALFLTAFCTLFVHIQVSTRMLCSASPCLYWFAADHMPKQLAHMRLRSKAGTMLIWFGGYFIVGTVLFSNNLPWT